MNTKKYMLNVLKNHRIYESFTCRDDAGNRIKYDLLAEEPPVGLLHDIAVGETELTANEKNTAMEMFSAYCIYQGAKILGKRNGDDMLNYTLVQEAMKCAEKCQESGNYKGFHTLLTNLVNWRFRDASRKGCFRVKGNGPSADGDDNGKWQTRTTPLEWNGTDDMSIEMNNKVQARIAEISLDHANQADNIELVHETMESCRNLGLLTEEQYDMLCHFYGIGGAHDKMTQTEIAKKLGVSPAYVSNKLADAYEIMHDFIACAHPAA
ncbi:MAG: hypothetical protein E7055_20425 [Lentisphaerae bacterium]|nr:hypothetical protein [Lentisphaerota bacterium]